MAETSSIFSSISPDVDIDQATDGLVSAMKAFKIDANDALDGIASKINIIGNTQAVSNGDIVTVLEKSSAAMASANNTLEQTVALGTAATEITRDASAVGNALKTISMRIRAMDEETGAYDETLDGIKGTVHDLTGVSIMQDENTYKSTYDILKQISAVWDDLTDKSRADVLYALFGTRQSNVGAAILTNFEAAEKSMAAMEDSAGNAEKEMSIIRDSLDYKLNTLSETGTKIAQNLFQRDDMKAFISLLTKLAEALDFATDKLGLFGTAAVGLGIFKAFKKDGRSKSLTFNMPSVI